LLRVREVLKPALSVIENSRNVNRDEKFSTADHTQLIGICTSDDNCFVNTRKNTRLRQALFCDFRFKWILRRCVSRLWWIEDRYVKMAQ